MTRGHRRRSPHRGPKGRPGFGASGGGQFGGGQQPGGGQSGGPYDDMQRPDARSDAPHEGDYDRGGDASESRGYGGESEPQGQGGYGNSSYGGSSYGGSSYGGASYGDAPTGRERGDYGDSRRGDPRNEPRNEPRGDSRYGEQPYRQGGAPGYGGGYNSERYNSDRYGSDKYPSDRYGAPGYGPPKGAPQDRDPRGGEGYGRDTGRPESRFAEGLDESSGHRPPRDPRDARDPRDPRGQRGRQGRDAGDASQEGSPYGYGAAPGARPDAPDFAPPQRDDAPPPREEYGDAPFPGGYGRPNDGGPGFPNDAYDPRMRGGRNRRGGRFGGRQGHGEQRYQRPQVTFNENEVVEGILDISKDGSGALRFRRNDMLPSQDDVFVSPQIVRRYNLREGSSIEGPLAPPQRPGHKAGLRDVVKVDGMAPDEAARLPRFHDLTVIDPDFHYEMGDAGDISLRVLDLLCPIGRGQRGLIVAPPRTGKTIFLHKVAQAMEQLYPDVHLMVLLVDERPEEGTAWKRLVKGDVFLSTLDEGTRHHVALAEAVFRRAMRLVECKKDVMILLDSITRMSRAYNAEIGNSGRILTGGVDSRTMEKPKRLFGAARNTEGGGALTILGTALVDTGSKMDQVIFEEFKGTGNMELVLSRGLADRRIFPAFDIGLSGTRKEEKLISPAKLKRIVTLRRVIQKMKPIEAMEQLLRKLERTPNNEEFLRQFELDGA